MSKYAGNIVTTGADAGYSVAFDGTGDYLTIADNVAFQFAGDFTIEFWIYANNLSATQRVLVKGNAGAADYSIDLNTTGTFSFNNNTVINTSTASIRANTWNHVAVTRSGLSTNNCTWWINGVASNTFTTAQNYNNTSALWFGQNQSTGLNLNGYLSNVRIVKGTALYTAAFTPPTQLLNITNTSLLTCNSPAIVDQSNNAFAITANGNAAVSTFSPFAGYQAYNPALGAATPGVWTVSDALNAAATRQWNMYDPYFKNTTLLLHGTRPNNVPTWITDASTNNFAVTPVGDARAAGLSPFSLTTYPNSGSGYFDGTGDYLTLSNSSSFSCSGNFTVEVFAYPTSFSNTPVIFDTRTASGNTASIYSYINTSGNIVAVVGGTTITSSSIYSLNNWYHIAVVRNGTSVVLYVNGTSAGTATVSTNLADTGMTIGAPIDQRNTSATNKFAGYLSNFRFNNATALYTTTFTPPTAPLTAVANTSLLTLQNSQSSNNNAFLDSSSNNFLITRNGNTTQGSFTPFSPSGWSCYLPSGSTLGLPSSTAFGMGTGDFTIAFWLRPDGTQQSSSSPLDMRVSGGGGTQNKPSFFNTPSSGTTLNMSYYTAGATKVGGFIEANQWAHVAYSRVSGTGRLFINGNLVGAPVSDTTDYGTSNDVVMGVVGDNRGFSTGFWQGNLSNVQIIKGTGFTSFPLPTAPATAINNTSALILQNNRLVDNSANNFTVSTGGTPSIQAFSPFNSTVTTPVTYSNWFDGTGDYIKATAGTPGSGSYTYEAFVYPTAFASNKTIFRTDSAGNLDISLLCNSSGQLLVYNNAGTLLASTTTVLSLNTWAHVALVRNGTAIQVYINGVASRTGGTGTSSETLTFTQLDIGGRASDGAESWSGCISNARYCNSAVYIANFTPATTPLTSTSQGATSCRLLTCQSSTFVDNSGNNIAVTSGGNVQPVASPNPFGFGVDQSSINASYTTAVQGGSAYFDGTFDFLTYSGVAPGTGAFTLECWFYNTGNFSGYKYLFGSAVSVGALGLRIASATLFESIRYNVATTGFTVPTMALNAWNHVVLVRDGSGNETLFLNGVRSSSGVQSDTYNYGATSVIGALNGTDGLYFTGYISGVVVATSALYSPSSTAIAIPTAPPTPSGKALCLNFTNAGIVDSSGKNVLETVGDAQITTVQSKFGGSSMVFDGTGDYLFSAASQNYSLTGDFTIEGWMNTSTTSTEGGAYRRIFATGPDNAASLQLVLSDGTTASGSISVVTSTFVISGTINAATGSWVHFAISRSGTSMKLFINGVQSGSTATTSQAFTNGATYGLYVGSGQAGTGRYLGYLQDLRITKGYARYTGNFTPPTSLLQNQ